MEHDSVEEIHPFTKAWADKGMGKEILQVRVICMHDACPWTGVLCDLSTHLSSCWMKPQTCKQCKMQLPYSEDPDMQEKHMITDCIKRRLKCEHCTDVLIAEDYMSHVLDVHPDKPLHDVNNPEATPAHSVCEMGCGETITSLEDYKDHIVDKSHVHHRLLWERVQTQLESMQIQPHLKERIDAFENILQGFSEDIRHEMKMLKDEATRRRDRIDCLEKELSLLKTQGAQKDIAFMELETRMKAMHNASYNGTLLWKISDVHTKVREAEMGNETSFFSDPFYTESTGYKLCARIFMNGDAACRYSHVSIFLVIMKGDFDACLPWPFVAKVTFTLIDQSGCRQHLNMSFRADMSNSFKRPTSSMNIGSGCPNFFEKTHLMSNKYVVDDKMFVHIRVEEFHAALF